MAPTDGVTTVVLETLCCYRGSEKAVIESVLCRIDGVLAVDANPVSQTATVTFDASRTDVPALRTAVRACGYECDGLSVPKHLCDPSALAVTDEEQRDRGGDAAPRSPEEVMGHPGHEGMSMDDMVRDMRNRFLVAALFSVPILLWSPIGRDVLGFDVAAPFGLRDDVWSLLLSLPVIFYCVVDLLHRGVGMRCAPARST